jgi:hypothetical protein
MFDPVSETWTEMAAQASARVYHSSSVLLPDARVMWLGAYADTGHNHDPTAQIYSPPYLFQGPRPSVASSPAVADYGEVLPIGTPDAASVAKVVLIRPSATTHSTNMEQRYVELAFNQIDADTLEATVVTNPNVAPPGYYMLFLVDGNGVPSVAPWLRIGGDLPPIVDAGRDQAIVLPQVAPLAGAVQSEDLPGVITNWSVDSGPGPVVFDDPSAIATNASFSVPGDYEIRLTATEGPLFASDSLNVTAQPVGTVQIVESRVGASEDDAEEKSDGSISLTSVDLDMHQYDPEPHRAVGLRFTGVQIPVGIEVLDAWIQFEADATDSAPTTLTLKAEASADAAPFSTAADDITTRPTTFATAFWNVDPWQDETSGPETRSPSLASLVQEVVDQPGWAPGNALAIVITHDGAGTSDRVAESFDGNGADAALLHVEYVTPSQTPPSVAITSPVDGSTLIETDAVTFSATASDEEDGDLSAGLAWTSDLDGAIGVGASFALSTLSLGTHLVTASVTDSDGSEGSAAIGVTVIANTAPAVSIAEPTPWSTSLEGDPVTFTASALDAEEGDLSAELVWMSDLDAEIGTGASFTTSTLSVGTHQVTATSTDGQGLVGFDSVTTICLPEPGALLQLLPGLALVSLLHARGSRRD